MQDSYKKATTLDKNLHFRDHIERVRNTALFYKARLGAVLGRKSKLSRRNKRTIYKMCIRTVMTYASPVFAHAAPKALHRLQGLRTPHYIQIYEGRIEAILRHRGITSQCAPSRGWLSTAASLSSGHRPKLPYSTRPPLTASGRAEGNRPVTVSCDILCRDDFLQASSSACHAPSALACVVRPHSVKLSKSSDLSSDSSRPTKIADPITSLSGGFLVGFSPTLPAYGREGVQDRHFTSSSSQGNKKAVTASPNMDHLDIGCRWAPTRVRIPKLIICTMCTNKVCYVWNEDLIQECDRIPVVLERASLVHNLIVAYGLTNHLTVVRSKSASYEDLKEFHSELYIDHLKTLKELDEDYMPNEHDEEFGIGYDCPPISNMYGLVCTIAGGSVTAVRCLILGYADIAINWCGGWHHAQRFRVNSNWNSKFQAITSATLKIHKGTCEGLLRLYRYKSEVQLTAMLESAEAAIYDNDSQTIFIGKISIIHMVAYSATNGLVAFDKEQTDRTERPKYINPSYDLIVVTARCTRVALEE
ncbi:Histone deacetylase 8 [Eumeta japonica]|uniref:histone deacetylase n=1 Tax=Eumeta variegata TaxID=151549 RepID=A0A4C1XRX2_EUMVA|nr:Histone deacetylase 8 [Eumeta japonica]